MKHRSLITIDLYLAIATNALLIACLIPVAWIAWCEVADRYATPQAVERADDVGYSLGSSGIRHNSRCEHYRADKSCSKSDGRPLWA